MRDYFYDECIICSQNAAAQGVIICLNLCMTQNVDKNWRFARFSPPVVCREKKSINVSKHNAIRIQWFPWIPSGVCITIDVKWNFKKKKKWMFDILNRVLYGRLKRARSVSNLSVINMVFIALNQSGYSLWSSGQKIRTWEIHKTNLNDFSHA